MNCKPGDLAIVIRSDAGNEGKIVRCIRIDEKASQARWITPSGKARPPELVWEIDRPLPNWSGGLGYDIADSQLRPIRDPGDDAVDETLQLVGAPSKEGVTA